VRMPRDPSRPRIGLVWAGSRDNKAGLHRSISLPSFAPLAAARGARFYSLQVGPPAADIAKTPPNFELIDLGGEIRDFADTTAIIDNLDLVISIDTSVAHLAGSMGKPVWILLTFAPDWRWLLHRDDSPWYPAARLFRQKSIGDWDGVMSRVADALAGHAF
jgi:ADP-heptose:LPS heptosyltransferase